MAFNLKSLDQKGRPCLAKFIDNFTSKNFQSAYKITYNGDNYTSHRYRSWEYCRQKFIDARGKSLSDQEKNELALQLAFYLASWGMYRGSSFLLSLDYTVHIPIVDIVLKKCYDGLFDSDALIENADYETYLDLMFGNDGKGGIVEELNSYLAKWRSEVKRVGAATTGDEQDGTPIIEEESSSSKKSASPDDVSTVLITKILMGVFGCIPAYDRYVMDGLGVQGVQKTFNKKAVRQLLRHVAEDKAVYNNIKAVRDKMIQNNQRCTDFNLSNYTFMKMVDMLFWEIGAGQVVEVKTNRGKSFDLQSIKRLGNLEEQIKNKPLGTPPYSFDSGNKEFKSNDLGSLLMCIYEELKGFPGVTQNKKDIESYIESELEPKWLATTRFTKKIVK